MIIIISQKNSSYTLLVFLVLTRCRLNLKFLTMLYHLLSHITQHFHAFLISYANILTSYTPLTVAKTSLSNRLLLLTDVALIFVTFQLKHNYPLSPPIIFRQAPSTVDRIVPVVHTLLTTSQDIPFTLKVKHAPSLLTLLITLKM